MRKIIFLALTVLIAWHLPAHAGPPEVIWNRPANTSLNYPNYEHSPAVDSNSVYFDGGRGYLCCVDKRTGKQRWSKRSGDATEPEVAAWCSPVVANGTVYAMCQGNSLYAFDAASGKAKWEAELISGMVPPSVSDTVVCAQGDACVQAFDAVSGNEKWVLGEACDASFISVAGSRPHTWTDTVAC